MIRRFAVCDSCKENKIPYAKVDDPDFDYEEIVGSDEQKETRIDGWLIIGYQNPQDPICVEFDHHCPKCAGE